MISNCSITKNTTKDKTLFENPLLVSPILAAELNSVDAAIVVQQIHYWLSKGCGRLIDGVRWIYNTYDQWLTQFPWLSKWKLRKAFYHLRELGIVKFEQHEAKQWKQKGWYTIDYEKLEALHQFGDKKMGEGSDQTDNSSLGIDNPKNPPPFSKPCLGHTSMCEKATHQSAEELTIDVCSAHTSNTETTSEISFETTATDAVEEEESVEEKSNEVDEPTDEEVRVVCSQIRDLSPELQINQSVRSAIRLNWANLPAALAHLSNAIRTWKVRPDFNWTGLLVKTLKTGVTQESGEPHTVKEYPRPSLEQLDQLGLLGKLVYTALNEPGYPEVLAVEIDGRAVLWWEALAQLGGETIQNKIGGIKV